MLKLPKGPEIANAPEASQTAQHLIKSTTSATLIGKTYSRETNQALKWLQEKASQYTIHTIDIETHPNSDYWTMWLKSQKILGLPVVLFAGNFTVGCDPKALSALLHKAPHG